MSATDYLLNGHNRGLPGNRSNRYRYAAMRHLTNLWLAAGAFVFRFRAADRELAPNAANAALANN